MSEYVFQPAMLAATLWRRYRASLGSPLPHAFEVRSYRISVALRKGRELFALTVSSQRAVLESAYGRAELSLRELEQALPVRASMIRMLREARARA